MNKSRVNRRAVVGLVAGTVATLAAGAAAFLVTGGPNTWLDPAIKRLMTIVPDHGAAAVVGGAAVPIVGTQGREMLALDLAADFDLSLEQIATASNQDLSQRLSLAVKRDCDRGMVVLLDGWVVPRSLARLCALAKLASA
jgi:hypothetical protein